VTDGIARPQTDLLRSVVIQTRVVGALIMREIITRYGRHNIGFMWVFVEPMMFTAGVLGVWSLIHAHSTKLPLVPFVVTGYSTVLLWRNTVSRCGNAIEPNRALLHHRNVRVVDLFIARLLLEVGGATLSFMTLATLLTLAGLMPPPDDVLKCLAAWLLLAWFAIALGLIVGSLSAAFDPVERIWHVLSYLFLPLCGAFYMVDWLPTNVQHLALLLPTVNCTELLREGFFGGRVHPHYDIPYLLVINTTLLMIALMCARHVSVTVEGE
jgi:capsular polysaccharide transport system permease protein